MPEWTNRPLKDDSVKTLLHVADPATIPASNSVLGPCFPLRTACLFTYRRKKTACSVIYPSVWAMGRPGMSCSEQSLVSCSRASWQCPATGASSATSPHSVLTGPSRPSTVSHTAPKPSLYRPSYCRPVGFWTLTGLPLKVEVVSNMRP